MRKLTGDAVQAERLLRQAVRTAEATGLSRRAAEARLSLVVVLADRGRFGAALTEAERAVPDLVGEDLAHLHAQRAVVLSRAGRNQEALASFDRAHTLLPADAEPAWRCRLHVNRGLLLAYMGSFDDARRDLHRARDLAVAHDLRLLGGKAWQNLGFAAIREGDVPTALRLLREARPFLEESAQAYGTLLMDLADAYLQARLVEDARGALAEAVRTLDEGGFAADTAEALILLARAQLLARDHPAAARTADAAVQRFGRQERPGWAALAEHLALRARAESGERTPALLTGLRRSTVRLARRGWTSAEVLNHLLAGQVAAALGRRRLATTELAAAAGARRTGPIDARAAGWYATALGHLHHGDRTGALRAAGRGLDVVDDHAASLGATDLRVHASGWSEQLSRLGVSLTDGRRDGWSHLAWVERYRANALRRRPARPPRDSRLAADLAALRRVSADLAAAALGGSDLRALTAEQVRLERSVRDRSRTLGGTAGGRVPVRRLDRAALTQALDDRALVEFTHLGGAISALVVVDGRCRHVDLGTFAPVGYELEALRFGLHRLARRHGSDAALAAAGAAVAYAGDALDRMLVRPLDGLVGDRDVVLTPGGSLHAVPWSALPSLRGRPTAVAPSATTWLDASVTARPRRRPDRRGGGHVAIAGPGLAHAVPEVRAVARRYPGGRSVSGRRATVAATLTALDGAAVAHVAAHGRFRADNPQFSALELADGALTVYDLEGIGRAPRQLVLSACDTALSAVHPGDELMGMSAAFLALGTSTIVASVAPVADDDARALMTGLHRRLAAGTPPARALAEAGRDSRTHGFVCFGAGG